LNLDLRIVFSNFKNKRLASLQAVELLVAGGSNLNELRLRIK